MSRLIEVKSGDNSLPHPPQTVLGICTPLSGHPTYQFWKSLQHLDLPRAGHKHFPGLTHQGDVRGFQIDEARTIITKGMLGLTPAVEWLLWIDDDMTFDSDAAMRLLVTAHELNRMDKDAGKIVGGLCFNRRGPSYSPTIYKRTDPEWNMDKAYGHCYDYAQNAVMECDATGAAFLLVHRSVFDNMNVDGKETWWDKTELMSSEDLSFCERAKALGYKIHVDTRVKVGHVAEVVIDEGTSSKLRTEEWQRWNPKLSVGELASGKPLASVVIPTYNQRPELLRTAVLSAIHQTIPCEVIVVDDGSNEECDAWKVLASIKSDNRLRIVSMGVNSGIATALNRGIAEMKTDWFCWLSSDDSFDPRKVELQLASLQQAGLLAGFHRYHVHAMGRAAFGRYSVSPSWRTLEEQNLILARGCAINGSTVMIHRDVLEKVRMGRYGELGVNSPSPYFDPTYRYAQDWEMWCRIGRAGFMWHETALQLGTRREGGNLTAAIAADSMDSPRRKLRDHEDSRVREEYSPKCAHCGAPQL